MADASTRASRLMDALSFVLCARCGRRGGARVAARLDAERVERSGAEVTGGEDAKRPIALVDLPNDALVLAIDHLTVASLLSLSACCAELRSLTGGSCSLARAVRLMKTHYSAQKLDMMHRLGLTRWTACIALDRRVAYKLWLGASPRLRQRLDAKMARYVTIHGDVIYLTVSSVFEHLWAEEASSTGG